MTTMTRSMSMSSPAGIGLEFNANGSLRRLCCGDITVNLFVGSAIEGGPANLYLRRLGGRIDWTPLLGPRSPAAVERGGGTLRLRGRWGKLGFVVSPRLAAGAPAWFWHVQIHNDGEQAELVDLVYAQDLGLADYAAVRNNEYYLSHYVDHCPLSHPTQGSVLASRQNLAVGCRHPWALIGSLERGVGYATDALQLYELGARATASVAALARASLASTRLQHEHSMVAIQSGPLPLAPGSRGARGFFGWIETDHPAASSAADLVFADRALALPEAVPPRYEAVPPRSQAGCATAAVSGGAAVAATTAYRDSCEAGDSQAAGRPLAAGAEDATARQKACADGTPWAKPEPDAGLFVTTELICGLDLGRAEVDALFGAERRHCEYEGEELLSFFTEAGGHVVLGAKERRVLRPHGHILRSGAKLLAEEAALSSTVWMSGVFNSLVTQGHVGINRLISANRSYLGLFRATGQRIFVELEGGYRQLAIPSAFEMTPNACRWLYKLGGERDGGAGPARAESCRADRGDTAGGEPGRCCDTGLIEIVTRAPLDRHELHLDIAVLEGPARRFLVASHIAAGGDDGAAASAPRLVCDASGIAATAPEGSDLARRFASGGLRIRATEATAIEAVGGDGLLFADGASRGEPFATIVLSKTRAAGLRIDATLIEAAPPHREPAGAAAGGSEAERERGYWQRMGGVVSMCATQSSPLRADVERLREILPWFAHNALVHYLCPHGLEQYSGGGWGTRDVCQGPVEMLLALGEHAVLRELLLAVFAAQNADGDWPQWFTFFDRDRDIRAADSHGDIVFWPLLALGEYLVACADASILDRSIAFYGREPVRRTHSLWTHVERALDLIESRLIAGTALASYGNGDWNDSLQPARAQMSRGLCSSWTVALHYQMLRTLAAGLASAGRSESAVRLQDAARRLRGDFQRLLVNGGVVAGFAYFGDDGGIDYLLHPSDRVTGISYRLLPMIQGLTSRIFTPAQAAAHARLIKRHLVACDGARLFDRPAPYRGGPELNFKRAESAAYFGREIGVMYTHAHLRYAEAMACVGDADAFFLALRQANPIMIGSVVASARARQANCYYSSSDAAFPDRYEAAARYGEIAAGAVPLEGGWRVYSSGPGIALRLVRQCLLGLRCEGPSIVIDPVIAPSLDGLSAELTVAGRLLRVVYRSGAHGYGPRRLLLGDRELVFETDSNPYRRGGARLRAGELLERLRGGDTLFVELG